MTTKNTAKAEKIKDKVATFSGVLEGLALLITKFPDMVKSQKAASIRE
jgi:hypothetical protein